MIPTQIRDKTHVFGPPEGWDVETMGECESLPVRIEVDGENIVCASAWKPTTEELRLLSDGGVVILRVHSAQPPVNLTVEEA